jgi:hypothetical protein
MPEYRPCKVGPWKEGFSHTQVLFFSLSSLEEIGWGSAICDSRLGQFNHSAECRIFVSINWTSVWPVQLGPSVTTSSTDFSFQNLVFLEFI